MNYICTNCGHVFRREGINPYMSGGIECPECKKWTGMPIAQKAADKIMDEHIPYDWKRYK